MENLTTEVSAPEIALKKQSGLGKFAYTLFMFIMNIAILVAVVALFFKMEVRGVLLIGIVLNLIYALICFKVKKGYRAVMIWWGILAVLEIAWWAYLLTQ